MILGKTSNFMSYDSTCVDRWVPRHMDLKYEVYHKLFERTFNSTVLVEICGISIARRKYHDNLCRL